MTDTALKEQLLAAQDREKALLDELAISQARERKLRSAARLVQGAENATQREHAFGMLVEHLGVWDESFLCAALAAERELYKKAFWKMRNVAASYSNLCDESGTTRRLEREFTEAEEMFRSLGD